MRTLDALHLASVLLIGEPVTVATHDRTMQDVTDPVGSPAG